ncbi:MAG: hypothetical protein ACMUIG_04530 [Thermoplasmatota archaeon]
MVGKGKKNLKVRTSARTASKGLEKELKRKAKRLAQDPTLVLPKCTVDVPYFTKIERKLREVQKAKDSKSQLDRLSKKGDNLVRAYAATLLLLHEDKITYLAVFRSPFGDVGYALRGSTKKEKLVGVQNYDDPRLKLMAYLEEVKKKKLFMFVTDNEVICTGTDPTPPKEVLDQLPKRLGKNMKKTGKIIHTPDLKPKIVEKGEPSDEPYISIKWVPADIIMARSLTQASQNKDNTYATCASYMATSKISQFFEVEAVIRPKCDNGSKCPCNPPTKEEVKLSFLDRLGKVKKPTNTDEYMEGKMMDHRLIEKEREDYEIRLNDVGETVYIIENICLGSDKKKLIKYLKPAGEEEKVLKIFLDLKKGPIIAPDPSVNRIMAPSWKEVGEELLKEVLPDKKIAGQVYKDFPVPRFQPMTVVQEGKFLLEEKRVRKHLPKLKDPPPMIEFAYECAVAYLVRGRDGASKILKNYPGDEIKLKAAKFAFVKHLDLEKTSGWSYTTHEMGYAQGMDVIVGRIITEDKEQFREGLKELWKATGSTKDLKFK